jgi:hypothetical protein
MVDAKWPPWKEYTAQLNSRTCEFDGHVGQVAQSATIINQQCITEPEKVGIKLE